MSDVTDEDSAALAALKQAAKAHDRAKRAEESARARLAEAIVAAARDGVRQTTIVDISGYTREHVRRITARALGGVDAEPE